MNWRQTYSTLLDSRIAGEERQELRRYLDVLLGDSGDLFRDLSGCGDPLFSRMGASLECLALALELHAKTAARRERQAAYDLLAGDGLLAMAFRLASDVGEEAFRVCRNISYSLIGSDDPRRDIRNRIHDVLPEDE